MLLADMGAEVIRVQQAKGVHQAVPLLNKKYDILARGRRSMAIDLKKPGGCEVVLKLVTKADALIEGFRPGVMACAAKAGIDQVTRTPAMEWGSAGVRVNAIAPGSIADTEGMSRLAPTSAAQQAWTDSMPLRRYGTKQDISRAVLWLCSEQASFITGVVLSVDGGVALGGSSAMTRAMSL